MIHEAGLQDENMIQASVCQNKEWLEAVRDVRGVPKQNLSFDSPKFHVVWDLD